MSSTHVPRRPEGIPAEGVDLAPRTPPAPAATDQPLVPGVRCPLSRVVVTAIPTDDWIGGLPYRCHACGAMVDYWVRDTDYAGGGRLHTHKVPKVVGA